jgi:hypothetical protein
VAPIVFRSDVKGLSTITSESRYIPPYLHTNHREIINHIHHKEQGTDAQDYIYVLNSG